MLNKELLEKLKEVGIGDSDLVSISESFSKKLDESLELRLTEEKIKLDSDYKKKLDENVAIEKTKLEESFNTQLSEKEAEMLEALDAFLESEINDKISEELIDLVGVNEADKEVIADIRKIFAEKYVDLDVEGHTLLKKNEDSLAEKTKELDESIAEKITLKKELDEVKKAKLVSEKVVNLSETQKKRVNDLFEGKDFKYTSEKLESFINLVVEDKGKKDTKDNLSENKSAISGDDKIITENKVVEPVKKEEVKSKSILSIAGEYL